MKKFILILTAIIIISLAFSGYIYLNSRYETKKTTFFAFDTIINLTVTAKDSDEILQECEREIYRLDKLFNVHSTKSEISLLNDKGSISPVKVSEELYSLIERSVGYSKDTDGAFDITIKPLVDLWDINSGKNIVPSEYQIEETLKKVSYNNIVFYPDTKIGFSSPYTKLDLGAVAKGYAADRLCEIIKNHSYKKALLDLGGNIYCMGDDEYRIGIQNPDGKRGEYLEVINAKNTSLVTGGGYERGFEKDGIYYHHIINPFDGYPADSGLKSVTVINKSSEMCDAYSTAVFVSGKKLAEKLCAEDKDLSFILIDAEGKTERID